MGFSDITLSKLEELQQKYENDGQSIDNYLDGLINTEYLSYWDYIGLDTLLSIQQTLTNLPDEKIFLIYHQHTELLFNLCLHELEQTADIDRDLVDAPFLEIKLDRLVRYFEILIDSFRIMYEGLNSEEFWRFRMALHPASGFQSVQFRKIELLSTNLQNLVGHYFFEQHKTLDDFDDAKLYQNLYWKEGATNHNTGVKNITLKKFEEKYDRELMAWIERYAQVNLWQQFMRIATPTKKLKELMRRYDHLVNVIWGQIHFKVAEKHLDINPKGINATGGTNWKKYLRPAKRKRIFYPHLWTDEEKQVWGHLSDKQ